jgi:hypothetical protein
LSEKLDIIAKLKSKDMKDDLVHRSMYEFHFIWDANLIDYSTETEHILIEATSKSSKLIADNKRLTQAIEELKTEIKQLNQWAYSFVLYLTAFRTIVENNEQRGVLEQAIQEQELKFKEMKEYATTFEFQIDELKFQVAKYSRRNEVLEKDMKWVNCLFRTNLNV